MDGSHILDLLEQSKKVILASVKPNGAIIASPGSVSGAKNYRYVWPRDALYVLEACRLLEIDVHERFFSWCMKAQGWSSTGLFYEKYYVNGKKALSNFQPDQTGSVLIAAYNYFIGRDLGKFEELIRKSADGLCSVWSKDHFTCVTQDLWEERLCFADIKDNFSYSLAICSRGLECAYLLLGDVKWKRVSEQMRARLLETYDSYFYRSYGKISDIRVDASLMGLVYPSLILSPSDLRMRKTLRFIDVKLAPDLGVHRYEHDEYDGWMYGDLHRKKGSGYWPLLNFWMAICLAKSNRKKALKYYTKVLTDLNSRLDIPEQIFSNNVQKSVSPLCWSHAMFVIATNELDL